MSTEKIRELLQQLQSELSISSDGVDTQTKEQLRQLDANIHKILNAETLEQKDIYDGIVQMEYGFLNNHPVAANLMREMLDILSKAGI
jgi:DNA-binding transcriptional MerR regulator